MVLLSRPHPAFKLFSFIKLLTFCVAIILLYNIRSLGGWDWATATLGHTPSLRAAETLFASAIPQKIWYKLGPKGLDDQSQAWIDTCLKKNPNYKSEFLTDHTGGVYVTQNFAFRPDIVETYLALSIPILKADLLRYLLLFHDGGIWMDLDVSCEKIPIQDWIPVQFMKDAGLVVGWEFDMGWGENFVRQFTTWTIMAKPNSPHMLMVINDILDEMRKKAKEHEVMISELTLDMIGDVVDLTGPRRMTGSIIKSLGLTLDDTVDTRNMSNLLEPKMIGDVLVLPGFSFAASSNRYERNDTLPLVTHHYAGSWKNMHGGERV